MGVCRFILFALINNAQVKIQQLPRLFTQDYANWDRNPEDGKKFPFRYIIAIIPAFSASDRTTYNTNWQKPTARLNNSHHLLCNTFVRENLLWISNPRRDSAGSFSRPPQNTC